MQIDNRTDIGKYYDTLVEKYGDSHQSCDYGRKESQERKFKVFLDFFDQEPINILDVGCGTGDFYVYLKKKFGEVQYEGIDLSEKMINLCKSKYDKDLFKHKNLLDYTKKKDFLIANGIFYLIQSNPEETMKDLIKHMFSLAQKGVAFNSLSSWALHQEENEFYADPIKTLEFCAGLTKKIVLRHEYLPHDFTIYMYK